jgi:hypothetical protein
MNEKNVQLLVLIYSLCRFIHPFCYQKQERKNLVAAEKTDDRVARDLFVHHKSKDTHHSGTSVVQFDGTLSHLGLGSEGVPSEVNKSVTEVTWEFTLSSDILHDGNLKNANEDNNLCKPKEGDGVFAEKGGSTIREGVEGVSLQVNTSGKVESGTSDDLSKEGKHGDTSVLEFDVTKTIESFLVSIDQEAKRIVESKGFLGTKFTFESRKRSGLCGLLGRSESSCGGDKGGKDGGLHFDR